ncbi:MAG: diguanylate cyclase [Deltaproteobacteria bacterium]|nr:diguanylate cyclase [Deltaproteobacteria bacterium]
MTWLERTLETIEIKVLGRFRLGTKILAGFLITLFPVVIALGYIGVASLIVEKTVDEMKFMDGMADSTHQVIQWTTDYALTHVPDSYNKVNASVERYYKSLETLTEANQNKPDVLKKLEAIDKVFNDYYKLSLEMTDAYIKYDRVVGNSFTDEFHKKKDNLIKSINAIRINTVNNVESSFRKAKFMAILASVGIIAALILSALFFGWRLGIPLVRLKKAVEGFEKEGNKIENLNIQTEDEVGELAVSFVGLSERLHNTRETLDNELLKLKHLVKFGKLIGDEISEPECYTIFTNFLNKNFELDRIVAVSFNNSENLAELIASYERTKGEMPLSASTQYDMRVIQEAVLCRAVRSGQEFVVGDVENEYRCPYQEIVQKKGSYVCFPVSTGGAMLGWVHLVSNETGYFTPERCFTIESYISSLAPAISNMRLLNAHKKLSIRDSLTGLYNRRFLDNVLEKQASVAGRYKQPLSVVMIDVDHFKKFNDTHGHAFGDKVLRLMAEVLTRTVRESDTVGRWGGEEFILVLPNTDVEGAYHVAEKVRAAVEGCSVMAVSGMPQGVTISLGISTYPNISGDLKELVESADNALYQSKATGRNKTTKAVRAEKEISEEAAS